MDRLSKKIKKDKKKKPKEYASKVQSFSKSIEAPQSTITNRGQNPAGKQSPIPGRKNR